MSDFAVGQGVLDAMAAADPPDEPRSDERYIVLEEGRKISLTFGKLATYYYYEQDGTVQRCPFL